MTGQSSIAILGDIGGHHRLMIRSLAQLGVDPTTLKIPNGLIIVQMGDLVRVSSTPYLDSLRCVQTADRLMNRNPGQWIQIIGNHDAALLGGPRRSTWRQPLADEDSDFQAAALLKEWWRSGRCRLAHHLVTHEYGRILLTHGGLTRMRWKAIGSIHDPEFVAERLNQDVSRPPSEVFSAGILVEPNAGVGDPDVTWPEVVSELYEPWMASNDMPFTQIHGHASPWNWQLNDWWPTVNANIKSATLVQPKLRRTITQVSPYDGAKSPVFVSTDWNLPDTVSGNSWPLLQLRPVA